MEMLWYPDDAFQPFQPSGSWPDVSEYPGNVGRYTSVDGGQGNGTTRAVWAIRDYTDLVGYVRGRNVGRRISGERDHEWPTAVSLAGVLALIAACAQLAGLEWLQLGGLQLVAIGVRHAVHVSELQNGAASGILCHRKYCHLILDLKQRAYLRCDVGAVLTEIRFSPAGNFEFPLICDVDSYWEANRTNVICNQAETVALVEWADWRRHQRPRGRRDKVHYLSSIRWRFSAGGWGRCRSWYCRSRRPRVWQCSRRPRPAARVHTPCCGRNPPPRSGCTLRVGPPSCAKRTNGQRGFSVTVRHAATADHMSGYFWNIRTVCFGEWSSVLPSIRISRWWGCLRKGTSRWSSRVLRTSKSVQLACACRRVPPEWWTVKITHCCSRGGPSRETGPCWRSCRWWSGSQWAPCRRRPCREATRVRLAASPSKQPVSPCPGGVEQLAERGYSGEVAPSVRWAGEGVVLAGEPGWWQPWQPHADAGVGSGAVEGEAAAELPPPPFALAEVGHADDWRGSERAETGAAVAAGFGAVASTPDGAAEEGVVASLDRVRSKLSRRRTRTERLPRLTDTGPPGRRPAG